LVSLVSASKELEDLALEAPVVNSEVLPAHRIVANAEAEVQGEEGAGT
jgi:hypothetical protein